MKKLIASMIVLAGAGLAAPSFAADPALPGDAGAGSMGGGAQMQQQTQPSQGTMNKSDLVGRKVDLIVAMNPPPAIGAKSVTSTIPIGFRGGTDPVADGLVDDRPEIRLEVDRFSCHLEDVGEPWPTVWRPEHSDSEIPGGRS